MKIDGSFVERKVNVTVEDLTLVLLLGLTAAAIARHVGVNTSAITRAIERMEERDDS